jgi:hypothetical protein
MEYGSAIPAFNFFNNYVLFLVIKILNIKTPKNYTTAILDIINVYSKYNYIFPKNIKEIPRKLFYHHPTLKKVIIPNSVISIGIQAFSNTGIENITIPDGVVSIGPSSFYGCVNLKEVIIPKSITGIYFCGFFSCPSLKQIEIHDKKIIKGSYCFSRNTYVKVCK